MLNLRAEAGNHVGLIAKIGLSVPGMDRRFVKLRIQGVLGAVPTRCLIPDRAAPGF
jgi:hypothetical protein